MNSLNISSIKQNRQRIRDAIKQIHFNTYQKGSPVRKQSSQQETAVIRRKRKTSECLKSFDTLSIFKDQSVKETFEHYFVTHEKLGEGAHSVVYRCEQNLTKKNFAVKVTKQKDLELMENMRQCYQILKELKHDSIIKGYYLFINEKKLTCHMVCQLCQYPTLKQYILSEKSSIKQKSAFNEEIAAQIIQSLLYCLVYLHDKGVCHRDIKPENILYDQNEGNLKLIDFQIAKMQRYTHQKLQLWSNTGTLHYRAPQTFKGCYGIPVDIWSIGIICYELLVGEVPFKSSYYKDTVQEIMNKEIELEGLGISHTGKILLRKLLEKDPQKRITAKEALSSPFILMNSTRCTRSPSKLNSSFDENDEIEELSESSSKFYDENMKSNYLNTISQDIGVRFLEE